MNKNNAIMSYYNEGRNIKETVKNRTISVATYERGAEIIVKALNFYFRVPFTKNQAVEMMHQNTAHAFKMIADFFEQNDYTIEDAADHLRELAEILEAQASVVSMRDELKFKEPRDD